MTRIYEGFATPHRSEQYRNGHRRAIRACVAWLHRQSAEMNDPHAKQVLNAAAFQLGTAASQKRAGCICPSHGRMKPHCPVHARAFLSAPPGTGQNGVDNAG